MKDDGILNEVRYLRLTCAPNIRERRKVENKFVKHSKEELLQQKKNVLKPETEETSNIDILHSSLVGPDSSEVVEQKGEEAVEIGTVCIFKCVLDETKVGVVLSEDTIQFYQPSRYGFQPEDLTEESSKWRLQSKIEDFDFITRRTGVLLR